MGRKKHKTALPRRTLNENRKKREVSLASARYLEKRQPLPPLTITTGFDSSKPQSIFFLVLMLGMIVNPANANTVSKSYSTDGSVSDKDSSLTECDLDIHYPISEANSVVKPTLPDSHHVSKKEVAARTKRSQQEKPKEVFLKKMLYENLDNLNPMEIWIDIMAFEDPSKAMSDLVQYAGVGVFVDILEESLKILEGDNAQSSLYDIYARGAKIDIFMHPSIYLHSEFIREAVRREAYRVAVEIPKRNGGGITTSTLPFEKDLFPLKINAFLNAQYDLLRVFKAVQRDIKDHDYFNKDNKKRSFYYLLKFAFEQGDAALFERLQNAGAKVEQFEKYLYKAINLRSLDKGNYKFLTWPSSIYTTWPENLFSRDAKKEHVKMVEAVIPHFLEHGIYLNELHTAGLVNYWSLAGSACIQSEFNECKKMLWYAITYNDLGFEVLFKASMVIALTSFVLRVCSPNQTTGMSRPKQLTREIEAILEKHRELMPQLSDEMKTFLEFYSTHQMQHGEYCPITYDVLFPLVAIFDDGRHYKVTNDILVYLQKEGSLFSKEKIDINAIRLDLNFMHYMQDRFSKLIAKMETDTTSSSPKQMGKYEITETFKKKLLEEVTGIFTNNRALSLPSPTIQPKSNWPRFFCDPNSGELLKTPYVGNNGVSVQSVTEGKVRNFELAHVIEEYEKETKATSP